MNISPLIAIISLFVLVIELLDPTTPFIRSNIDTKEKTAFTQEYRSRGFTTLKKNIGPVSESQDAEDSDSSSSAPNGPVDYHSAVIIGFYVVPNSIPTANWFTNSTGLETQFSPATRKRPPIS